MRSILSIFAIILLVLGLISMFSPIPGGTLFIAAGCALLICTNERAAHYIQKVRTNKTWVNKIMTWLEDKMGERLSAPMRRTRPNANELQGTE